MAHKKRVVPRVMVAIQNRNVLALKNLVVKLLSLEILLCASVVHVGILVIMSVSERIIPFLLYRTVWFLFKGKQITVPMSRSFLG